MRENVGLYGTVFYLKNPTLPGAAQATSLGSISNTRNPTPPTHKEGQGIQIPRSDTNGGWGVEYEVTVTSEPHNHTSRNERKTDKGHPLVVMAVVTVSQAT